MGIYLNPGNENLSETVRSGNYIDKIFYLSELITMRKKNSFL